MPNRVQSAVRASGGLCGHNLMVPVLFAVIRPGFLPVSRCSAWVLLLILRFPLIPSLMCPCVVTENRYITDNPLENRTITRESGHIGPPKRISRIIGPPKRAALP